MDSKMSKMEMMVDEDMKMAMDQSKKHATVTMSTESCMGMFSAQTAEGGYVSYTKHFETMQDFAKYCEAFLQMEM